MLWRPLHEAEGRWFWWGAKGPESFKKLYYLLYELLTYHYKLNNLIWVWNAIDPDWLVEEEFFDIVGVDFYAPAGDFGPLKFKYDQALELAKGEKPVALTENGPIPDPDLLFDSESYFLWFMPWWGKFVFDGIINPKEHLIKIYNSERVITLEKIN
ncbi:MAG: hypothetical protein CBR30_07950 [Dictyoglomus sp. NZ13-RE01]|nr:MAG: hypothetical protein CBR30_07950 [Dictyoglomus sp. NZ13-RE01]